MKSALLSFVLIMAFTFCAKAQYVSIPDTGFGVWLYNNGLSTCMAGSDSAGWQLDTTCPAALADTVIVFGGGTPTYGAISLAGIQYLRNLKKIDILSPGLQSIPYLPPALEYLNCSGLGLDYLPAFPATLKYLNCSYNNFDTLILLPDSLTYLNCGWNNLNFITNFPVNLDTIYCEANYTNNLNHLPTLPPSLRYLACGNSALDSLPVLPSTLLYLDCQMNSIHALGVLPNSLTYLECSNNHIDHLSELPPSLQYLDAGGNNLETLPALPAQLTTLWCFGNNLLSLPNLPDSLFGLVCFDNPNLNCMPTLNKVVALQFYNTMITCLPNYPTDNVQMIPSGLPLCTGPCYPLGITDISSTGLLVYPNPASDKIQSNLPLMGYTVTLTDITGRIIPVLVSEDGIDISGLPMGVYTLHLQNSQESFSRKVVKD